MQNIGFLHSLSRLISQYLREYSLKVAHLMSYKNQDDVHGKLDHNLVADSVQQILSLVYMLSSTVNEV